MTARCGTVQGYDRHLRFGEPTCQACREAYRLRRREWRDANPKIREVGKRQAAAQRDAVRKLQRLYPAEWLLCLMEARREAGLGRS